MLDSIIKKGYLFPSGRDIDNKHKKLTLKLFQYFQSKLEYEATIKISKAEIYDESLKEKLINDNLYDDFHHEINLVINTSNLLRTHVNYFTSNIWDPNVYCNKYITLHYELNKDILNELLKETYGDFVLYGEYGSIIKMPQPMPNKFIKSIILQNIEDFEEQKKI